MPFGSGLGAGVTAGSGCERSMAVWALGPDGDCVYAVSRRGTFRCHQRIFFAIWGLCWRFFFYIYIYIIYTQVYILYLCQTLIFLGHQARPLQPIHRLSFHGTFPWSAGLFLSEMAKRSVLQGHILQGLVVPTIHFLLGFGWVTRLHAIGYRGVFWKNPRMTPLYMVTFSGES